MAPRANCPQVFLYDSTYKENMSQPTYILLCVAVSPLTIESTNDEFI